MAPKLSEEEIDDLVYLARAGEATELTELISTLATREGVSDAEILLQARDEGKSTCLHMATGNGHLGGCILNPVHIHIHTVFLPSLSSSPSTSFSFPLLFFRTVIVLSREPHFLLPSSICLQPHANKGRDITTQPKIKKSSSTLSACSENARPRRGRNTWTQPTSTATRVCIGHRWVDTSRSSRCLWTRGRARR